MSELAESGSSRYVVKGTIGRGGMAIVYHVADQHTGLELALKRLRPSQDGKRSRKLLAMFQQEFRTLAQLAHPNVVAVRDFGTDDQGPYYTMELLNGEHLHALAPLPWVETCALMRDVCSAVALLHSRRLLHRDPSPKNVQRTRDGRAKLIDFGAMSPMGPSNTLVGTAPLVPPEALLQQPLDARADLFAIGGTLYYALTGKHAYPAHDLAQLHAVWRRPPFPPSAHAPGIPEELDRLVLSLLSLERMARPSSAAEVLDRLTAIARLPRSEQVAVPRAYLSTPELVGRDEQLSSVRLRLTELHAGRSGVIALVGAPGMGRSRMLDGCVLEAKLSGVFVARASAADALAGSYGVLSALARQLDDAGDTAGPAEPSSDAFTLLIAGGIAPEVDAVRRPELQAAFQGQLAAIAQLSPVLLAVDDIDRCDEASLAALAAVASTCAGERVLIGVCGPAGDHGARRGPLAILLQHATRVHLSALQPEHTEALLASVFGDVPNLHALAGRVHALAEGSPRGAVELSQYLIDRELVRYEMGGWVVPAALADAELPATLSAARRGKLMALSSDARELAEALALCDGTALDVDAFAELTGHADRERVGNALDELLLVQVLRRDHASYVFEAQLWPQEPRACLDAAAQRRACARIADALARRGRDRLEIAGFRLRAGEAGAAIDLLLEELGHGSRWNRAPRDYRKLLRAAIDACGALQRSRRDRMMLLRELIKVGQDLAAPDLREHTLSLLAELRRDSGLDAWEQPGGPTEPLARLQHIADLLNAQRARSPAREHGFNLMEAVTALAALVSETSAIAARTGDASLLDLAPRLEPFYLLSPAIRRIDEITIPASRAIIAGRYEEARQLYEMQLQELLDPALAGVPEDLRLWGIRALHYAIGNIEASLGRERALFHAAEIEGVPGWLVPAYSIRQTYQLTVGNLRQAERYRRQIELTLLQSPIKPPFSAAAVFQHVFVFSMSDNPNGMRAAIPELEALAQSQAAIRPFVPYARAEHARICGNYDEALAWLERAADLVRPGMHPVWPWLVTSRLFTLLAQGRYEEARVIGLGALETAEQLGLLVMRGNIDVPLALVEAKLGDFASACARMEQMIDARVARDANGVALGSVHEMRARIALWMRDMPAFERHARLCAQHFGKSGGEPALAAKYDRLMQEARHHGLPLDAELADAMASHTTVERTGTTHELPALVRSAITACRSRRARVQRALELIVNDASAQNGELFLLAGGALELAASTAEGLGGVEWIAALSGMVEVDRDREATAFTAALELFGTAQPDGSPTRVLPLLLVHAGDTETAIAGIVTLHFAASATVRLPSDIASAVAAQLIACGDVTPRVLGGSATTVRD